MENDALLPIPTELMIHIATFICFKEQVLIFTLLNKPIRQLFEQVILSDVMKQSSLHPIFKEFHPSSILFENAIEQMALTKQFDFLKTHQIVRSVSELCFMYCGRFTPCLIKQSISKINFSSWKLNPLIQELPSTNPTSTVVTAEQTCCLKRDSDWHNFYFPSICFKAVSGITYWFSFLLKDFDRSLGKNFWKILLGVVEQGIKKSNLKLFSHSPSNYGFIVGTGEKVNGARTESQFSLQKCNAGDVITFAMEFEDDSSSTLQTIRMRLHLFCNLKPMGLMFSQLVSINSVYHPICALCETSTVVFRMDGISSNLLKK